MVQNLFYFLLFTLTLTYYAVRLGYENFYSKIMDVLRENGIILENFYRKMCRICLQISDEMNQLFTMQFPSDSSELIIFLRKICELTVAFNEIGLSSKF